MDWMGIKGDDWFNSCTKLAEYFNVLAACPIVFRWEQILFRSLCCYIAHRCSKYRNRHPAHIYSVEIFISNSAHPHGNGIQKPKTKLNESGTKMKRWRRQKHLRHLFFP